MNNFWRKMKLHISRFPMSGMVRTLCIPAFLLLAGSMSLAQTAFVRVNQVGYPVSATKRAYLMTSTTETGATFKLTNSSGTSVFSAAIGTKLGSWGSFSNVYALDFDSVTTPGTYTITVTGPALATSPSFPIDVPATFIQRHSQTVCTSIRTSATARISSQRPSVLQAVISTTQQPVCISRQT